MYSYLSLSKPKIMLLLNLSAATSVILAARSLALWPLTMILVAGSLASAGSSAINSYFDRDIDSVMERTKRRPVPSGRLAPRSAVIFGLATVSLGIILGALTLNLITGVFVGLGAFVYVVVYTVWLKRRSVWNIVLGGFAGSCAALAGWSAVHGSLSITAWLIAALIFLWTPGHFWSLALRARADYAKAQLPMLPVVKSLDQTARIIAISNIVLVPFVAVLYFVGDLGPIFLLGSTSAGLYMILQNLMLLKRRTQAQAWKTFKASSPYLAVVLISAIADTLSRT